MSVIAVIQYVPLIVVRLDCDYISWLIRLLELTADVSEDLLLSLTLV